MMPTPAGNHSTTTTRFFFTVVRIFLVGLFMLGESIDAIFSSKSSKSPKSPKYLQLPKETCLVTGYVIEGTTELQIGDTRTRITNQCSSFTPGTEEFEDCFLDIYLETAFSAPFQYELNGASASLQFTIEESLIGDGSLQGSIGFSDPYDKVILSYLSTEYIQGENDELWNRPVSDLEYIEYSFKVDTCGAATSCPEKFYLNVYTRSGETVTAYFECRYDFVPSVQDSDWTTVRFDLTTVAQNLMARPGTAGCPAGPNTLENAGDNGYVLGTNDQFPSSSDTAGVIFALNMGDTSAADNGLSGYFDRVVVKMQNEDARIFDLDFRL